jgi:hypothetical protein
MPIAPKHAPEAKHNRTPIAGIAIESSSIEHQYQVEFVVVIR